MSYGKKRTKEEIEEIVNEKGYILLDEYVENDNRNRIVFIQDNRGYKYNVQLAHLIRGHIPYFVGKGNPNTLENIVRWLKLEEEVFELCENNEYKENSKKLWFHCLVPECHENFDMSWSEVYSQGSGCPYCSGQRLSDKNRLSIIRPDIGDQWDYKLNNDTPDDVSFGSDKSRFWICPKGHQSYPSTINNRTNTGAGCPRCSGLLVSDDNRLSILFSDIAGQWDYKLNEGTPEDFSYGSTKNKYWICPKGHESYLSTINSRTNKGTGCPICGDEQKESKVATELKGWANDTFKSVDVEHKMFKNPETGAWLKCDIYIGEPKSINGVYIEVHGGQHFKFMKNWHKTEKDFEDQRHRDKIKKKFAKKNGRYIEVDLRKIKTTEQAIGRIENIIGEIENDSIPKRSYRKTGYKV